MLADVLSQRWPGFSSRAGGPAGAVLSDVSDIRRSLRTVAFSAAASGRLLHVLLLAALGVASTGNARAASADQDWPVQITDAVGRQVSIAGPPQRIIPVFASNAELVAALGLSDRIVGVEAYTRFPPELAQKPQIGGRLGFSVDAIAEKRPELVIVTPARQAMHQLIDPMTRLGVPVMVLLARDVGEVLGNLRLVGKATGEAPRGEAVADALQGRLDKVALAIPAKRPSVVMLTGKLGNGLVLIARSDTYTGDAIVRAGGRLAVERSVVSHVSPEAVIAADPDVLLFAGRSEDLEALKAQPGWKLLRAVREGRAWTVARAEFLIPGPRTVNGIEKLAERLRAVAPRADVGASGSGGALTTGGHARKQP